MFKGEHLGIWIVMWPFLVATLTFLTSNAMRGWIVKGGALGGILLAILLGFQVTETGEVVYALGEWQRPLGIHLRINGLSALMIIVNAILGGFLCFYSLGYFSKKPQIEKFFWPLSFFCYGGLNVLFLSYDLFNIYVALEIVSFSAISLVTLSGSAKALIAATQYFFLTLIGSLLYLLGVAFIYGAYSTLDLGLLTSISEPSMAINVAVTIMTVGLIIKGALFPMHFWLPSAHANAPAPVSAMLSGLVVMGAFYMLVNLWFDVFVQSVNLSAGQVIGFLGAIAILGGAIMALRQTRLKMMLAYSTISQIGYMFLIFPLYTQDPLVQGFAWHGGLYLSLSHAFAKASAFMVAGIILFALGRDHLKDCYGLAEKCPLAIFAFGLAGVSLIGLPPSGGFIGKWMLLKSAMLSGQIGYGLLIAFGSILSAAYIFRIFEAFLHKPLKKNMEFHAPMSMQVCAFVIAFIATLLGLLAVVPLDMLSIGSNFTLETMKGLTL